MISKLAKIYWATALAQLVVANTDGTGAAIGVSNSCTRKMNELMAQAIYRDVFWSIYTGFTRHRRFFSFDDFREIEQLAVNADLRFEINNSASFFLLDEENGKKPQQLMVMKWMKLNFRLVWSVS
ncbi:hypothetical protein CEXT_393681 [Caerostris extrusa]|uniref:Uncharacterized protein n=1 Tax=Caerostris extrusa TaxID=172846 RepID=A0AAV4T7J4_CAEEX|nr:hypothetical protein CEXT_393681 [Caerostris extrusa]